jgi:hypothetical protein
MQEAMMRIRTVIILIFATSAVLRANAATSTVVYQVAFVPKDFALNVWSGPGSNFNVVDSLVNGEQIQLTGPGKFDGQQTWIPISYHTGKTGWANQAYLVGTMQPDKFCGDARIAGVLTALKAAVQKHDSQALAKLVAPQGLFMLLDDGNTIRLSLDEVRGFFTDQTLRNWGPEYNGPPDRMKSLATDITPLLESDLLPKTVQIKCNDSQDNTVDPSTLLEITIPGYQITNFYSVKRPGVAGHELEWGTWGVGIAYWDDKPAIIALAHYIWTP